MKLIQTLFLVYFQTKFKLIALVSAEKAAAAAFNLFCTPYSRRKTYQAPAVFEDAEKIVFPFQNHTIHGFQWKPEHANDHKILICHGFDSLSYRFEKYIEPLLQSGFEILAFDAPGHGLSTGKTINALLYKQLILDVCNKWGPVSAIMAHSFGGIAAALAIEEMEDKGPKQLVLIAPATETTRSLNDFCRHLKISGAVKTEMQKLIVRLGGQPAEWFSVARIIKKVGVTTLWLHDKNDRITPYEDMEHLLKANLPHVKFVITEGLGHSLYTNEDIAKKIIAFFNALIMK